MWCASARDAAVAAVVALQQRLLMLLAFVSIYLYLIITAKEPRR